MSYIDKTRLVLARMEGEDWPLVIGAVSETTWEIIPPDDWDKTRREMAEKWLGPDWTAYDFVEVVMTYPAEKFRLLFEARHIEPDSIEAA